MAIRIFTDSSADLPRELMEKYQIVAVPLKIRFGDEEYRDGVDLTVPQFYEKLLSSPVMPSTSQPSPGDFVEAYTAHSEPGDTIISIQLSSELSGTYQSANLAASMVEDREVVVVDGRQASSGTGMLVLAAAEAAAQGKGKDEIVEMVQRITNNMTVYFIVGTLEYLHKNGRIGKAASLVGSMLKIKPILRIAEGIVQPHAKARGTKRAVNQMIQEVAGEMAQFQKEPVVFVVYTNDEKGAKDLAAQLVEETRCPEPTISQVGPVIGSHTGPDTFGILVYDSALLD
ncbi:MAG TPA: DegV family protein [Firmicutes bacterium]|nr:DegV family protein [Bacillota bacterium]